MKAEGKAARCWTFFTAERANGRLNSSSSYYSFFLVSENYDFSQGQGSKTWCRFTEIIVNCDHEVELDTLAVAMSYYPRSTVLIVVKMVNSLAI